MPKLKKQVSLFGKVKLLLIFLFIGCVLYTLANQFTQTQQQPNIPKGKKPTIHLNREKDKNNYPETYFSTSFKEKVEQVEQKAYESKDIKMQRDLFLPLLDEKNSKEENAYLYATIGYFEYGAGNFKTADEYYKKALEEFPQYGLVYTLRSLTYEKQGDYEHNILYAKQALLYIDSNAFAHFRLGWAYYLAGEKDLAIKKIEQAIKLDPKTSAYRKYLVDIKHGP